MVKSVESGAMISLFAIWALLMLGLYIVFYGLVWLLAMGFQLIHMVVGFVGT